ncbi:MAG: hypothetical protein RJB38_2340 [Pseudomonadota bacterium]|jgi:DAACS family dicarboxylate/amino acid:cation (Na+ or H+) symporter
MILIFLALVSGAFFGVFLSEFTTFLPQLSEVSKIIIQLIKAIAVPLLFFAIVNAVSQTLVTWRQAVRLFLVSGLNATVALAIGLGLSHLVQPGRFLRELWSQSGATGGSAAPPVLPEWGFWKTLSSWIPTSVVQPFYENAVIPVVVLALVFGLALKHEDESSPIREVLTALQRLVERMLFSVTRWIPLAVFASVAASVAKSGFRPFLGLFPYLGVAILGLTLHIAVTYQSWIVFFARISLRRFWREAREPIVQSFATNSSLATLPFTLRALDRLGVSRRASALGACVGTNLNNDGIVLYEGMAFLFVAQAMGLDLSWSQQVAAAGLCLVTAMGIAGVPEAGFVSLALVLSTVGISTENLGLLLSVDWILGRARSITNVLSDMVVSIAVDDPRLDDRS